MQRTLLTTLVLSLMLPVAAMAEERNVADFNAIHVGSGFDLVVREGRNFAVEVESDSGNEEDIITEVRNNILTIRKDRSFSLFFNWWSDEEVTVTLPELVELHASGGSDVEVEDEFSGELLDLSFSGGSDLVMEASFERIELSVSGGSDVELSGEAREVQFTASGGSDISALRLEVEEAWATASGGSDIELSVEDELTARASGGSDITYRGDPQVKDINSSGGSDVSRR